MPDFAYQGNDPVAQLVYQTEVQKHRGWQSGFCVVAPHIFASYREDGKLKVFVTTYAQSYRLYDNVLSEEGGGIVPAAITYGESSDGSYTLESYEQAQDGAINLKSVFICMQEVLKYMIPQKKGKIIHISSIWGMVGASCEVHYSTAKAGIIGLTKALAKELGPSNIQVNCIAHGYIVDGRRSSIPQSKSPSLYPGEYGTRTTVCKMSSNSSSR